MGLEDRRRLQASPLVEMAVAAEDEAAAVGVAHLLGDHLDVAPGRDPQRRACVAQVVEGQLGNAGRLRRRLEDAEMTPLARSPRRSLSPDTTASAPASRARAMR